MAMLALPDEEREVLEERFNAAIESFNKLEQYDTSGAEPLVTVLDHYNVMREDIPAKLISRVTLLSNAPEQSDGYFRAPATID